MYDIIIVGAGPAGMCAALYALRANKKVLVFESKAPGGQILNSSRVENYPALPKVTGFDFANNLYNQVKELGCEFKFETVIRVDEDKCVTTNKGEYKSKAVILATGSENRKLKIPGETELIGKGVSYCATCDGNFYKGKTVAVVGGGNTAIEDALYLADLASKVYLIHRRSEFKAEAKYIDEIRSKDNVFFVTDASVLKINGEDKVESIDVSSKEEISNLEVDGVFIAVGREPKNQMFSNVAALDDYGYFVSEDGVHTKVPGVYVAGDARVKSLRQLTTAVSDGSIAATVAIREMK